MFLSSGKLSNLYMIQIIPLSYVIIKIYLLQGCSEIEKASVE